VDGIKSGNQNTIARRQSGKAAHHSKIAHGHHLHAAEHHEHL
jgi:hypothetical protein